MAHIGKVVHFRLGGRCHAAIVVNEFKDALLDLRVFYGTDNLCEQGNRRPKRVKFGREERQWHGLEICDE